MCKQLIYSIFPASILSFAQILAVVAKPHLFARSSGNRISSRLTLLIYCIVALAFFVQRANGWDLSFNDSGQSLGSSNSIDLALGDVDGDGDLDAFVPNNDGAAGKVWLNDGTGTFTDSGQSLGSENSGDVGLAELQYHGGAEL